MTKLCAAGQSYLSSDPGDREGIPPSPRLPSHSTAYLLPDNFSNQTCQIKGKVSELAVQEECIKRGCQVFAPVLDNGEIDLIILTPLGRLLRCQVKTALKNGPPPKFGMQKLSLHLRRNLRSKMRNHEYRQIDVFIAVYEGNFWVIPRSETNGRQNVCLGWQSPRLGAWESIGLPREVAP